MTPYFLASAVLLTIAAFFAWLGDTLHGGKASGLDVLVWVFGMAGLLLGLLTLIAYIAKWAGGAA